MHPLISVFGETTARMFPLILVIGREPNTHEQVSSNIGNYNFRDYPHCGFWNSSYRMVARTADMDTRTFKNACEQRNSSLILYADALPIGLPNAVQNKHLQRRNVSHEQIDTHVTTLFDCHPSLTARIQCVILSGLYESAFGYAQQRLRYECQVRGIAWIEMPFFHGVNSKHIEAGLTSEHRQMIRSLVAQFMAVPESMLC